jgi:hypothetical protein
MKTPQVGGFMLARAVGTIQALGGLMLQQAP